MPLITLTTNQMIENCDALAEGLSSLVSNILNKPESYVMVHIDDKAMLMFAGNHQPCALLELKSLGLPEDKTADLSSSLCDYIQQQTAIDSNRIYIEFSSPQRHLWGWDGRTF